MVQHDAAPRAVLGDGLDDRLDRGEPGAVGQTEYWPAGFGVCGRPALGLAEQQGVSWLEVVHQGVPYQTAVDRVDCRVSEHSSRGAFAIE